MRVNYNVSPQGSAVTGSNGGRPVNQLGDQVSSSTEISLHGLKIVSNLFRVGPLKVP